MAVYEEERLARVEDLLGMGDYSPDDPGGDSVPNPDSLSRPSYIRLRENSDHSVSVFWSGASPVYQVHEFLADPSATLKATVTVGMRTSGPLTVGNTYEYAVRGVVGASYTEFSEHARITIGQATTSYPGGSGGWTPPTDTVDPGSDTGGGTIPGSTADVTQAAVRYGWGVQRVSSDEFTYTGAPDPTKWSVYDGAGHNGNGIRTPARVTVDGTKMVFTGLDGTGNSAGMMHKERRTYGRYEWRARSFYTNDPTAPGNKDGGYHPVALIWPSKPLNAAGTDVVAWPRGGEYDAMENGEPGMPTAGCFNHYPSITGENFQIAAPDYIVDMRQFNNFAIEWTKDYLKGYINGELWYTMSGGAAADRKAIQLMEEGRFCFQLDAFKPDTTANNIATTLEIEWVRFYDLTTTSTPTTPTDPTQPTNPTSNSAPWAAAHQDGIAYPTINGGGAAATQNLTSLGSVVSNAVYNYTGATITAATSLDFTGKSNITIRGIKLDNPATLRCVGGTNIWIEVDAQYELQNGGETVKWVGVYDRCLITNSLFGPATAAATPTTIKNRFVQWGDSTAVGAKHGRVTRSTFRNKNGPGNPIHTVGDTANATGGVRYTLVTLNLFQGVKPFDENDHETNLMGISTLQLTNGQQIVEFNRYEDCRSEPEVISMKMNWSTIRGNTFHNCVGSLSLRHGDDGEINDNWVYGFQEETGSGSYNRTSAGPRLYGARHKVHHNTVQVNGNGGSRASATSIFETPLTLDAGDVTPGSTSNGHANIVSCMVENNLLVKCGNPIVVPKNYSTAPTGTVRNNWIVECANAGTDGVRAFGAGVKTGLTISGNTVYATVAAAGLTAGPGGHYVAPASAGKGARVAYLTATMVGRGSTYDPYGGTVPGSGATTQPTTGSFTMAFASCINATDSDSFTAIKNLAPDYFYMAGDCWYDDGGSDHVAHWNTKFAAPKYASMLASLPNPQIVNWSDHDFGFAANAVGAGNSITPTANAAYRTKFPNVALEATTGIYRTWTRGRIRFIMLDERSFKSASSATDDSSKTMLGAAQKTWFKNLLKSSTYPLIVVLGDTPWVGTKTAADDAWKGYDTERQELGSAISASPASVIRLSGDMHCLAYGRDQIGFDRVWQAAPLNNETKVKEGGAGYVATYPVNGSEGPVDQLFGVVTFSDDGSTITATYRGYSSTGTQRLTDSLTINAATTPTSTTPTPTTSYPADILNLQRWKLNIPTLTNGKATEIAQPKLATYSDKFFFVNAAKDGVCFRVYHGGETTANSPNPRSELREMTADGKSTYNWDATSGTHSLTVVGMITHQTVVKPHNVLWQIHGGSDDVTVFRREANNLYVTNGDNTHAFLVTSNFPLNQRYTLKGEVINGTCYFYLNGTKLAYTLKITDPSCYFKAGNYLQSNPTSAPDESTSAYADVIIHSVSISHA